ncbi:ROK family protein [Brachybacterium sp. GCM10030267]|uniref:ROK family transcriptional regulator n=1 Tax=unclassified Brachybacterium TaxID=2623841 RepID=UPI003621C8C1
MNPLRSRTAAETAMAILDLVRRESPISRVELSHATGLTETSISKTVRRLLEAGLVEEAGRDSTGRGKSRTMLKLASTAMYALGVVLDDTRINCVLTDFSGAILAARELTGTRGELPHDVTERVAAAVLEMLSAAGIDSSDVAGACLASPGRFDAEKKKLRLSSVAAEWEHFDVQEQFTELTSIPATLEKDYGCAALAEHWVARDTPSDFVTVYVANGIGAGIVIDGELYGGLSSNAGEIGHLPLDPDGPECNCGNRGCLERIAAPQYLVRAAMARPELAQRLGLDGARDTIRSDFEKLARGAARGDDGALELISGAAERLAQAVLGLVNTLDAGEVVLAGPALEFVGDIFAATIQEALDHLSFMRPVHSVSVRLSGLGLDGAALGAAIAVLRNEAAAV